MSEAGERLGKWCEDRERTTYWHPSAADWREAMVEALEGLADSAREHTEDWLSPFGVGADIRALIAELKVKP